MSTSGRTAASSLVEYRDAHRWGASVLVSFFVASGMLAGGWLVAHAAHRRPVTIQTEEAAPNATLRSVSRSIGRVVNARLQKERLKVLIGPVEPASVTNAPRQDPNGVSALQLILDQQMPSVSGADYVVGVIEARAPGLIGQLAARVAASETDARLAKSPSKPLSDLVREQGTAWSDIVRKWGSLLEEDVSVSAAWKRLPANGDPPRGTVRAFVDRALAPSTLTSAVSEQMAADASVSTVSPAELQAAGIDLGGRLTWAIAAVLFAGLWVGCVTVAFWQIWTLVPSPTCWAWVGATILLATGAGFLSWRANALAPDSLELLGALLARLDEQSGTTIMSASRFLTALAGSAIVVLLIASAAITSVQDDALHSSQLEGLRTTFNAAAALLVAAAIEISALYGWAAAAFEPSAGALSNAAMLAAGFVGALFSAALFAVYLPAVSTLRQRVPASASAMDQQGFGDSAFQQFVRLLQGLAPLFAALPVSMLVSLLQ